MGLHLTAEDFARFEAASRMMLSPLAASSVDDWRRDVNQTVRELFRNDQTIFMLPKGERLFFSEEAPDLASGVEQFVTAYAADGIHLSDSVVDLWQHLRRKELLEVFTWSENERMISRYGHTMHDSEMVSGVLQAHHVRDFTGCYVRTSLGEVLLWMLFEQQDTARFGEYSSTLLRALLPSFKSGLDTLIRLDTQRQALDLLSDAVVVFGPDRIELHRNSAFSEAVDTDPERDLIYAAVWRLSSSLQALGFPGIGRTAGTPLVPVQETLRTKKARYDLKGTLLQPGVFGDHASVMIVVIRHGGTELPQADILRERYGLTAREAEVALLLAEGYTNEDLADRLFLSPHTTRRHTANIFDKLAVNTRKALALKFLKD